jgi:hypothetical protein
VTEVPDAISREPHVADPIQIARAPVLYAQATASLMADALGAALVRRAVVSGDPGLASPRPAIRVALIVDANSRKNFKERP